MTVPSVDPVVITGLGLTACLGLSAREVWDRLIAGERAMSSMPALESPVADGDKPGGNGGQAPELPAGWMNQSPREVRYLRWAVEEALRNAQLLPAMHASIVPSRVACFMGTTLHGMRQGGNYLRTGNYRPLCSFLAASTLSASLRGLPVEGMAATNCSACSSGLGAVALGVTALRSRAADVVIVGGYDPVSEYAYAGFDSMRLVAAQDLKPFCKGREGMKLAEGYAVLILERAADAAARGATVLAEVAGIGESADSHHLTQPHPEGEGALRAIEAALKQSGLTSADIGLIAAHATATPNNDASEFAALSRAMGPRLSQVPLVAFKSHLGHTLGAAGAAELILSLLAMQAQTAPPTANISTPELEFPTLLILERPRPSKITATLNTSLGFGGANTCVALKSARAARPQAPPRPLREVCITGVGFLAPAIVGNDAFVAHLAAGASLLPNRGGSLEESDYAHLINARRVRRLSEYSKLTLAATSIALQHAGIADIPLFAETCAALLGTTHGAAQFCYDYYKPIVEQGMAAANPVLFAEGVPNAASAQLSLMLGLKGCCQTIIGSRTAGLDALRLAAMRIASGEWERVIVGAAEEDVAILREAYRHAGLCASDHGAAAFSGEQGFLTSSAAASLVLESRDSIGKRPGARVLATIRATSSRHGNLKASGARMVRDVLAELGDVDLIVSSANGTWLDRVESQGVQMDAQNRRESSLRLTSMYGCLAETFSVGPLAAIVGAALAKRLPGLSGQRPRAPEGIALQSAAVQRVAVLSSDWNGMVTGVRVELSN